MKGSIVIILLLSAIPLSAQNKKDVKPGWRTITAAGLSAGKSETGAIFQLSGGITYGRWFNGIGIGYDNYYFNSFPLFADLRMSTGKRRLIFVYINPGYTIPGEFKMDVDFSNGLGTITNKLEGGFYMDAGMGCRIPLGAMHRLSLSGGYISKSMVHKKTFISPPCGMEPCPNEDTPDISVYRYRFGLLTAKLSWEWGR